MLPSASMRHFTHDLSNESHFTLCLEFYAFGSDSPLLRLMNSGCAAPVTYCILARDLWERVQKITLVIYEAHCVVIILLNNGASVLEIILDLNNAGLKILI